MNTPYASPAQAVDQYVASPSVGDAIATVIGLGTVGVCLAVAVLTVAWRGVQFARAVLAVHRRAYCGRHRTT